MASGSDTAPAWLFSFVDLAFLLLIALTQVGGGPRAVDLGEMIVPRVNQDATASLSAGATQRWQIRVHPPASGEPGPFELLRRRRGRGRTHADGAARTAPPAQARAEKPLLAPHQDSAARTCSMHAPSRSAGRTGAAVLPVARPMSALGAIATPSARASRCGRSPIEAPIAD
jgi:hypothetical protein